MDSIFLFSQYIQNYESQCLIFVIDSNLPFSILDNRIIEIGFNHASNLPHRTEVLFKGKFCPFETCPYFQHPNFFKVSMDFKKFNDCVLLSHHFENFTWNSCSF